MRDLRGQTAQDVIYAGPRKSLGLAEVRMAFEQGRNEQGDTPEELTVARRLYRSGESEYLLNGQRVRLRDVTDALRSIGIDDGEHVVVNQGMADALLSASPADRRGLLEQAAGLAGYRTRRDEARGKLAISARNVETIETLLAEMEPRLRILRRQARAVADRDDAQKRLRSRLQVWYAHRWAALLGEVASLQTERDVVDGLRQAAVSDVKQLEEAAELILTNERAWQREMDVAASSLHLAEREQDAAHHSFTAATHRHETLQTTIAERLARLRDLGAADVELAGKHADLEQRLAEYVSQDKVLETDLEKARDRASAMARDFKVASSEAATRAGDLRSVQDRHANETRRMETIKARLAENEARLIRLDARLEDSAARLGEILQQVARLQAQQSGLSATIERHQAEIEVARRGAQASSQRLARIDRLRSRIRTRLAETTRRLDTATRTLSALQDRVAGSPIQRLSVQRGWEAAAAAALEGWNGEVLECDLDGFLAWRGRVETAAGLPFMWADHVTTGITGASPLHGAVFVAEEDDVASVWQRLARLPSFTVGAPPILVITSSGRRKGAIGEDVPQMDDAGARYLRTRRQQGELQSRHSVLEARLQGVSEHRDGVARESAERTRSVGEIELALRAAHRDLSTVSGDVEKRRHQRDAIEHDIEERRKECETIGTAMGELQEALLVAEGQVSAMSADVQTAIQTEAASQETLARERLRMTEAERELSRLRSAREALAAQKSAQEGLRDALKRDHERTAAEKARLELELADLRRSEAAAEEEMSALREAVAATQERAAEAAVRRMTVAARKPDRNLPATVLQEARGRLAEAIPRHERVLARLESRVAERDSLADEVSRELGMDPGALPQPEEDVPSAQEIQRLRTRASQYPDADESVITEARELDDRYRHLQSHAEDLRSAADNLREIMDIADREMRGRFSVAFDAVNEEFGRVFRVMLRGGEAELWRNEDGGVDIRAQLPGKKTRSSAAFSGGERSLVASSLLFGVLRIRPTPFCILDEVDAALDESNVDRYLAALRDISDRTQVILVTHNRATMAAADMLYGMTMDDEGASSLLSLRLEAYAAG